MRPPSGARSVRRPGRPLLEYQNMRDHESHQRHPVNPQSDSNRARDQESRIVAAHPEEAQDRLPARTRVAAATAFSWASQCPQYRTREPKVRVSAIWLPFVDTFRTMCLAPDLGLTATLEEIRDLDFAG